MSTDFSRFDLEQRLERDEKVERNGYGIVCTLHRGIEDTSRSKKLYTVGDLSTGKAVLTGALTPAVDRFLSLVAAVIEDHKGYAISTRHYPAVPGEKNESYTPVIDGIEEDGMGCGVDELSRDTARQLIDQWLAGGFRSPIDRPKWCK